MTAAEQAFDSLPYIDKELTQEERDAIVAKLNASVPSSGRKTLHPSLPALAEPRFSPVITAELERVAAQGKLEAIDQSRYEALDPPEDGSKDSAAWRETLRKAYAAQSYLANRQENLALLEEHGKNTWLVGNYHLEHQLKALEKELVETREAVEAVNKERKQTQENSHGELEALERTWRTGVGRILEIEVASEQLRQAALEARRQGAVG